MPRSPPSARVSVALLAQATPLDAPIRWSSSSSSPPTSSSCRRDVDGQAGKTVIAGYHWFNDWGRDTMIALPGLTLPPAAPTTPPTSCAPSRATSTRACCPTISPTAPARCPATTPWTPRSGTSLAIAPTSAPPATRRWSTSCCPCLRTIVDWHVRGTRYGIGVDPADGLLRAGEPGVQLTWMDARVGDWVVTPRIGKPVEIQALWYNALRSLAALLRRAAMPTAADYDALAERVRDSFRCALLPADELGYLADVVDGPDGDELRAAPEPDLRRVAAVSAAGRRARPPALSTPSGARC